MTGSRIFLVTAAMALVLTGCGGDDDTADTSTTDSSTNGAETTAAPAQTTQAPTTQTPTTQTPTTTGAPGTTTPGTAAPDDGGTADEGGTVVAVADTDLGTILVDGEGLTLYLFGLDEGGVSSCTGSCAESWPPVAAPASAGDGVDDTLLESSPRDDGADQVTYDGHPLYRFAGDGEPGDTTGQGINDVWFVVSPTGEPVTRAPIEEGVDDY